MESILKYFYREEYMLDKPAAIGIRIKELREGLLLNRQEFARKFKINVDNLYKWERGTKPSDPKDYKRLEEILNEAPFILTAPDLAHQIGVIEDRIIKLESYSTVLFGTCVSLLSQATGKQSALVSAELNEAVSMVIKLKLDELRKKGP